MVSQRYIKMFIFIVVITILANRLLYSQSFEVKLSKDNLVLPRSAVETLEIYVNLKNISSISLSIECDQDLYCYAPSPIIYSGTFSLVIGTYLHTSLGEKIITLRANYSDQYEDLKIRLYVTDYEISSKVYWVDAYVGDTLEIPFCLYLKDEDLINVTLHAVCPPSIECRLDKTWSTKSTNFTLYVNLPENKCCYQDLYDICVRGISVGGSIRSKCLIIFIKKEPPFSLLVFPNYLETLQGHPAATIVDVQIYRPLEVNLSIENCPPNSICSLNQTVFTSSGKAILTIFTTRNTPLDTYYITIKATDNRSVSKNATLTLSVLKLPEELPELPPEPPKPPTIEDFNITLSQNYLKLIRNSEKTLEVYVKIVGNITVELSIENCPPNSICSLNQTVFTSSGKAILKVFSLASIGEYFVKLVGRAKNITKRTDLTLSIVDFDLILPENIDIGIGGEKTFEILLRKYGILNVELSLYCPSGIICTIDRAYQKDHDLIYSIVLKVPSNISPGNYLMSIEAIAENVVRSYIIKLNVLEPEKITTPEYDQKVRLPVLPKAGMGLLREKDIIDIPRIQEISEFKGYKPEIIDYAKTTYYGAIRLEEDEIEIIKYQPTIVKTNYLNVIILLLIIIVCIEILILLKRKLTSV